MNDLSKKIRGFLVLVAVLSLLLTQTSTVSSLKATPQDEALQFITDVFQLDMLKYTPELATYSTEYPTGLDGLKQEFVKYDLQASDSKAIAFCAFSNGSLTACSISSVSGKLLYAKPEANTFDAAKLILNRYQDFSENPRVEEMINLMETVNTDNNVTKTIGDIKIQITTDIYHTSFDWAYTFNGVDYKALSIVIQEGEVFFSDYLKLYKIGKTDVNLSREKAIDIAMKYIDSYSFTGIVGSPGKEEQIEISGFNITKELTKAVLSTNFKEPLTWYPCWNIELYLDQKQPYVDYKYPSGIYALSLVIWADSGEVFSCTPMAVGVSVSDNDFSINPSPQPNKDVDSSPYMSLVAAVLLVIVALIIVIVLLKRNR